MPLAALWANGGYRGALIAWIARSFGRSLQILDKLGGRQGFQVLPKRSIVERPFALLNRQRRLVRDLRSLAAIQEAFIYVAMIRLMPRG